MRWYSTASAAEAMDVSRQYVFRRIQSGEIPAVNIAAVGKKRPRFRIAEADLKAYMDRPVEIEQVGA